MRMVSDEYQEKRAKESQGGRDKKVGTMAKKFGVAYFTNPSLCLSHS